MRLRDKLYALSLGRTEAKRGLKAGMQLHMTPMLISRILERGISRWTRKHLLEKVGVGACSHW